MSFSLCSFILQKMKRTVKIMRFSLRCSRIHKKDLRYFESETFLHLLRHGTDKEDGTSFSAVPGIHLCEEKQESNFFRKPRLFCDLSSKD